MLGTKEWYTYTGSKISRHKSRAFFLCHNRDKTLVHQGLKYFFLKKINDFFNQTFRLAKCAEMMYNF